MTEKFSTISIKRILKEGFSIHEILDLIDDNFKEHYTNKAYSSLSPNSLSIETTIREFVNYCENKDKLGELVNILYRDLPNKVKKYPLEINELKVIQKRNQELNVLLENRKIKKYYSDGKNNSIIIEGNNNIIIQDVNGNINVLGRLNNSEFIDKTVKLPNEIVTLLLNSLKKGVNDNLIKKEEFEEIETNILKQTSFNPELFFTDRKLELLKIDEKKHIFLYSPSGYGKTHLLQEVKRRYKTNDYSIIDIKLKEYTNKNKGEKDFKYKQLSSKEELYQWLSNKDNFNFKYSTNKETHFSREVIKKYRNTPKIIFIVDDFEKIFDYSDSVRIEFIKIIKDLILFFTRRQQNFIYKVILSSRNVNFHLDMSLKQLLFDEIYLTPFYLNDIKEVLIAKSKHKLSIVEQKNIITEIYKYTGGHPGATIKIIDFLIDTYFIDEFVDKNAENYFKKIYDNNFNKIIKQAVYELLPKPNNNLIGILMIISVFRLFTDATIKNLIDNSLIDNYKSYIDAKKDILSTNLFKTATFYSDAVARHLISNYFLISKPDKFKQVNQFAIESYKNKIGIDIDYTLPKTDSPPAVELIYIFELIYHIVLKYSKTNEINEEMLYDEIDIVLEKSFTSLTKKYNKIALSGLKNDLIEKILSDKDINAMLESTEIIIKTIKDKHYE